ncbi:dihydrolipoyl dehydrogenase [Lujinxingia sediminis]|uniref:Dihydrolipoyl dehydrogenase n=1 Tax=Lujinxingia sediminis TaxID=2480984 RepID=A0ABY0CUN0_9DELT|nr:dihydrolipoyl dehydrogenase [Lujinxingia sediminis]RVU46715.1 dihydrolipoyl dehydrogenase [Lujinxingia sediminis]
MYDLVVIGSGPGGYIAAIRAAQLDMKVAVVERYATFGGTCLNVGCIPSKALLESSERYEEAKDHFADHGITVGEVSFDLKKMLTRKDEVVASLTGGVAGLFQKNNIATFQGHGTIVDTKKVEVKKDDGSVETLETERILIATGSKPITLPGVDIDKEYIVDSTGALDFQEVPGHLVIIGAGVIGLELGSVWRRLGAKVTVIEYLDEIFGGRADKDVARLAQRVFKKQGIDFELGAAVTGAEVKDGKVITTFEQKGETKTIECDRLLVGVGRKPYTEGLGLENIGLETTKRGFIEVNAHYETSVKGVYAIGDVIPGPMLAHLAEHEGVTCVERIKGIAGHVNYDAIPDVVYTHPEIASVGKTEQQLKEAGIKFKAGKFPFKANGRARALNDTEGFVKILADAETDRILGAHIIGPRAGDLIAELAVAVEFGSSAEDIARSTHAHPTLAEVIKEAALDVDGRTLNL